MVDGRPGSAIQAAAVAGHEEVVRLLLDAGARADGLVDSVDAAFRDGLLSSDQHQRLRSCCACCPANCACCAGGCTCKDKPFYIPAVKVD